MYTVVFRSHGETWTDLVELYGGREMDSMCELCQLTLRAEVPHCCVIEVRGQV